MPTANRLIRCGDIPAVNNFCQQMEYLGKYRLSCSEIAYICCGNSLTGTPSWRKFETCANNGFYYIQRSSINNRHIKNTSLAMIG